MDKIHFTLSDDNILYDCDIRKASNNVIGIDFQNDIPATDVLLSGFDVINENNGKNMSGDYYHSYNTLYKDIKDEEKYVMLSNDGSIFVEPEPIVPEEIPVYEPTLEEVKMQKINELSSICNMSIVNGVDIEIDGTVEHFSYNEEDQVNIKELFDLAIQSNTPMYYHADGQSCKLYTVEQIAEIYSTSAMNKMHHITYFNQMKMYVESLDDKDIVSSISYGDELAGEYLDTYNAAMSQAQLSMEVLFTKSE